MLKHLFKSVFYHINSTAEYNHHITSADIADTDGYRHLCSEIKYNNYN